MKLHYASIYAFSQNIQKHTFKVKYALTGIEF